MFIFSIVYISYRKEEPLHNDLSFFCEKDLICYRSSQEILSWMGGHVHMPQPEWHARNKEHGNDMHLRSQDLSTYVARHMPCMQRSIALRTSMMMMICHHASALCTSRKMGIGLSL
jgi:hypothetical protein